MTHSMQLQPSPFEMIKDGSKTIELRLFDEKRRKIRIGDTIAFTNTETREVLSVRVLELMVLIPLKRCTAGSRCWNAAIRKRMLIPPLRMI